MSKQSFDFYKKHFLKFSLRDVLPIWLEELSLLTRKNYSSGINRLVCFGILDLDILVEDFSNVDHNDILDKIKKLNKNKSHEILSESSVQARSACYISFTKFLNKWSKGKVYSAVPSRSFGKETFFKIREKIKTNILSKNQWLLFFDELKQISFRDYLIGKLMLQGIKGIGDVLNLKVSQLDFHNNKVIFLLKRRRNRFSSIHITYPMSLFSELKSYIGDRKDWVFVSNSGEQINMRIVYNSFSYAGKRLDLSFKVTPRVLKASALAHLKKLGFSDSDIIRISGHSSLEVMRAYDFSFNENMSTQLSLMF